MLQNILKHKYFMVIEFFILCIALPGYIIFTKSAPFMFSFLWGAALYAYIIMRICYPDELKNAFKFHQVTRSFMPPLLIRWVVASIAMVAFLYWYDAPRLFFLPRTSPEMVLMLLFLYPLISALPQEFIFCSFFFRRYKRFFGTGRKMVLASALIFAYAHVLYLNPVAPVLSFIGGLIFAETYRRTHSLALVTVEHGLYGNALFVIGLGWYFYGGAVH
ncbi:MAG: hypothetical protein CL561_13030 [Alphaproteobacteria bacterium]|nr:hypothetical protein [Alphaproteobacteria bacterium]|tara:strand:+ start:2803 stop:3456 length:654 start_codon:yes stop_codon:yes gene_type:complete